MSSSYWISKSCNGWIVRKDGAAQASSVHDTQSSAWGEARRLARGSGGEALLKGNDGKVRARNAYGKDPFPTKG